MERITYLQVETVMADCEVRVNDIPVARVDREESFGSSTPTINFLQNGMNSISYQRFRHPTDQNGLEEIDSAARIAARIADFQDGEWMEFTTGQEIATLTGDADAFREGQVTAAANFQYSAAPRRWRWLDSPIVDLNTVRAEVERFTHAVLDLMDQGDFERLANVRQVLFDETSAGLPALAVADLREMFLSEISEAADNRQPRERPEGAFQPRLIANGRLIEVLDDEGLPYVRSATSNPKERGLDPSFFELELRLGYLQGRLAMLL